METPVNSDLLLFPRCPIRNILSRIADKWSMLIILTLSEADSAMRFKDLQRAIPDISQKVLTSTLRVLQADGYVHRQAYAEVPPRVEYTLTERSHSLMPHLQALITWAKDNMDDIMHDRQQSQSQSHDVGEGKVG